MSSNYIPVRDEWLALASEEAIEPSLPIIDAHHHFYDRPGWNYLQREYLADASSGHHVQATVYMQALTRYWNEAPQNLRPVGETEFVANITEKSNCPNLAEGIVSYADLRMGSEVVQVLEAHEEAGRGRFRGIRHLTTWDADSTLANPLTAAPQGLLSSSSYQAGLAQLQARGLSYDAWLFWPQLAELYDTAVKHPALPIVINHCGGIVRIGAYAKQGNEVFLQWRSWMRALAQLPNVHVKLGGLGMRINGFGFEQLEIPPSSDLLAAHWRPWMLTCIEEFGPERCMFESNFPVDKGSYSFVNGWNAMKKLTSGFSSEERHALFHGTASRVYRLA